LSSSSLVQAYVREHTRRREDSERRGIRRS
jgi:hypothetical protein